MRITTETNDHGATVRVDGHLSGDAVSTFENALASAGNVVRLELDGLVSADDDGLGALRRVRAAGVKLSGISPFLSLLLDAPDEANGPSTAGARGADVA